MNQRRKTKKKDYSEAEEIDSENGEEGDDAELSPE